MFIGREKELSELERAYKQDGFQISAVSGVLGAGKTTLLEEFCKGRNTIFFTAADESGRANLQRFSQAILSHYKDHYTKPFSFWQDAFKYIADNSHERIILVLDDFSEIAGRDPVFMNMFNNVIDNDFRYSKIFLVIMSSDVKFMQKYFFDRTTPMHEKLAGKINLEKFVLDDNAVKQLREKAAVSEKGVSNARLKMQKISADSIILREGQLNQEMYKIISGKALCYFKYGTDNEYLLASLKEGSCFGEFSLLTGKPGIYTVVAFTDLLVMRITKEDFGTFVDMNAKNSVDIMRNMAKMLNVMAVHIDMILGEK